LEDRFLEDFLEDRFLEDFLDDRFLEDFLEDFLDDRFLEDFFLEHKRLADFFGRPGLRLFLTQDGI
jgi:hypothetical protein